MWQAVNTQLANRTMNRHTDTHANRNGMAVQI